jgi:ABC-2 type transport system permease protein
MSRLLGVELRRFFARRLTRMLAIVMLLGVVATGIGLAVNSSRDVAGAHATARQRVALYVEQAKAGRADCLAHVPKDRAAEACGPADQASQLPPGAFYTDPRFSFHDHVRELVRTGVYLSALLTLLAAASFVGAEWQAGTFASLLTWEPRRLRVYLAKLSAAIAGAVGIATVSIAAFVGVAALVAATRGTFATVVPPERQAPVHHLAGQAFALGARGLGLVALTAAVAATLATLMRHTVAAVGAVLAYFVIGEGIIGSLRGGDVRHHLLSSYVRAMVDGTYTWFVRQVGPDGSIFFDSRNVRTLHALHSGLLLAVLLLLLIAGTAVVLERRDVA